MKGIGLNSSRVQLFLCFWQVRRTRISDRIRKLQELVPNMDKVIIDT